MSESEASFLAPDFFNEYDPNYPDRFQIVERRRHTRFTLVQAYIKKQCYDVVKIYDRQQKRFLPMPKIPGTVLKGSKKLF